MQRSKKKYVMFVRDQALSFNIFERNVQSVWTVSPTPWLRLVPMLSAVTASVSQNNEFTLKKVLYENHLVNVFNGPDYPQDVNEVIRYKANEKPCASLPFGLLRYF